MQKYKLARRKRRLDPDLAYLCHCYNTDCYCNGSVEWYLKACSDCATGTHVARNGKRFAVRD